MAEKKTSIASSLAAHQARIADRIHSIDLRDLRLLRGFCNIPIPSEKKLLPELTQSIGIKSDSADTRNVVAVQISFSILGNYENGDEGLRVEAVIGLLYAVNWINQATEEDIAAFSQAVAVNNAWPYWREFVQSMTVRMGLPPLRIPLLRMDQLHFTQSERKANPRQEAANGLPKKSRDENEQACLNRPVVFPLLSQQSRSAALA